jgi:hypothetical protein
MASDCPFGVFQLFLLCVIKGKYPEIKEKCHEIKGKCSEIKKNVKYIHLYG